jgi:excisionase family DNA binding protein
MSMGVQDATMTNEELLTVREVADRLKIHPETVRTWLRAGRIHGTSIGGRRLGWRIPASEVQKLIAGGFSDTPAGQADA